MNLTSREYLFFVVGLLAAVWFFIGYPSQDPRHIINLKSSKASIEKKAVSEFESLGYESSQYRIQTSFHANQKLLDSLQATMGREKMIDYFRNNEVSNIEPFYWEVQFKKIAKDRQTFSMSSGSDDEQSGSNQRDNAIKIRFRPEGEFLEFINPNDYLPYKIVNRPAIASAFTAAKDSLISVLSQYSDSVLTQKLIIDVRHNWHPDSLSSRKEIRELSDRLHGRGPFLLSGQDVFEMATHYLSKTGWQQSEFKRDSVQLGRIDGVNTAMARFKLANPKLNQQLFLNVKISATGGLLDISSVYNPHSQSGSSLQDIASLIENALILLLCLAGLVIFFFRIRARAIDTKPALVVSILAGVMVSLIILMSLLPNMGPFSGSSDWTETIGIMIGAGLGGAAASLGMFVFFSIGDSINRQHWGKKLAMYDYLRQGMVYNKPIGSMLVRSVILSFILAGVWTLTLWLFPHAYFDIRHVFQHERAAWPLLYTPLYSGWSSLIIIIGIFLVLGGQVYAMSKSRLTASAAMVIACVIVIPVTGHYGPFWAESIIGGILGLFLTLIYIRWDFLTLLLSHFLFMGLTLTTSGWVVGGSLDEYIFILFLGLIAFLMIIGFVAMSRGKDEKVLSDYVPEYVEELAQEERIKQELQIAREVQQSFLPLRTPEFDHLELAAICQPAYETGGDYYDFIQLDKDKVAVTIGDVSGKGIQAAFYMTFIKGILHSLCRESESPAEILKKTNRLFCDNAPRGIFISLIYGIIDLKNGIFHFARAGHNPILKMNTRGEVVEELQPKGIGIGLTKSEVFDKNIEEVKLEFSDDDVLVLYTDGIVEALNENHTSYGTHRLNNLLKKNKDMSAPEILQELSRDVSTYIGEAKQHDDMTMMIIKLKK